MARKGKNTRKVVQPVSGRQDTDFNISDTTGLLDKRQKGAWEEQIRLAGKMNDKVTDLAGKYEDIFTTQQGMLQETNALYGIEKQTLSNLAAIANKKKIKLKKKIKQNTFLDMNSIKCLLPNFRLFS